MSIPRPILIHLITTNPLHMGTSNPLYTRDQSELPSIYDYVVVVVVVVVVVGFGCGIGIDIIFCDGLG